MTAWLAIAVAATSWGILVRWNLRLRRELRIERAYAAAQIEDDVPYWYAVDCPMCGVVLAMRGDAWNDFWCDNCRAKIPLSKYGELKKMRRISRPLGLMPEATGGVLRDVESECVLEKAMKPGFFGVELRDTESRGPT